MNIKDCKAVALLIKEQIDMSKGASEITQEIVELHFKIFVKKFVDYLEDDDKRRNELEKHKIEDKVKDKIDRKQFLEWCGLIE